MPLDLGKEKLEQRKLYIIKSIAAIEEHSKLLQKKHNILLRRLESLKFRKMLVTKMINHHTELNFPFLQILNMPIRNGEEREFIIYLN
jgi:hypothetical protein